MLNNNVENLPTRSYRYEKKNLNPKLPFKSRNRRSAGGKNVYNKGKGDAKTEADDITTLTKVELQYKQFTRKVA